MAIIYSYPSTDPQSSDLLVITRQPSDPDETANYSVSVNKLSNFIIANLVNGTDNYIPKFDGTASLVNSIIYQDDDGHVGIGVPGSTPNPIHKFEVYDDRSENVSSDYTQVNSTVVGPPWTGGAGGVLSRLSTDGGSTFPYGISLIPGTTASDIAASGRLGFFSNSNLDTNAATGYSGQVTFDGSNPHWIFGGSLTDTTTRTLHVKGDVLVDTDLEVDGGLDVAGTVRLGFTGNDPVILGNPTGKRTEWNNPGYFEIYAENPDSPGDFNETVDIDGEFLGGGYLGVYPVRTENRHGVRIHSRNAAGVEANYIDIASVESSAVYDEDQIRLITAVDGFGTYAGIKVSHPTDNRFRFNSEFNTEPTVPFLVNSSSWVGAFHASNLGVNASVFGQESEASGFAAFAANQLGNATGAQSASFNFQTTASGGASASFGAITTASGNNSFATGDNTVSSGVSSFTAGSTNNASGDKSAAFGQGTVASGTNATSFGENTNALGNHSISFGLNTTAGATNSFAFGNGNTASGVDSVAGGRSNTVSSENSIAFGLQNNTSTASSGPIGTTSTEQMLFGRNLFPPRDVAGNAVDCQFVVGKHNNDINQPPTAFVVGTGSSASLLKNSFTVLYDGKILMEQVVNFNYPDDTAAAAGGVPIGGVYHSTGLLRIRIT